MKFSLVAALAGFVMGKGVYNLDDTAELAALELDGLYLAGAGASENLKVASSNGATGFSWLIDRDDCRGVIDITNGYVFVPPATNDGFDVGFGEEIFTLTATEPGACTFRIAYANPAQFTTFDDYENRNGLIISIPIEVGDAEEDDIVFCDYKIEDCDLKSEMDITKRTERMYKLMGAQAWMHTFTPFGLVTWLPQAITWVKSGRDRLAAERFLFTTKYWSQIVGWLAVPASIIIAVMAMDLYIAGGTNREYHLLSPHLVGRGRGGGRRRNDYNYYEEEEDYWGWSGNWWWSDWYYDDDWDDEDQNEYVLWVGGQVIGIFIISIEIASWIMYYVAYKGSVKYGNYLVTLQSTTSDESF